MNIKKGNDKKLGVTQRFINYLKYYTASKSEDKFRKYYSERSNIAHEGGLFLSDYDLFGNIKQQDENWMLRLELLQAARLSLFNWLRTKR
jgi:hypothetical protein